MADYWKSQPRKFCDFCKCWIADNKPSRDFHEKGKKHQENVKRKLDELRKKGKADFEKAKEDERAMQEMEEKAMAALKKDIMANPSLAAQYGIKIKSKEDDQQPSTTESTKPEKSKPEKKQNDGNEENDVNAPENWYEAHSPEGYTYYWNAITQESRWVKPDGYTSPADRLKAGSDTDTPDTSGNNTETSEKSEKEGRKAAGSKQSTAKKEKAESSPPTQLTSDNSKETEDNHNENPVVTPEEGSTSHSAYGQWETVRTEPETPIDLQLPVSNSKSDEAAAVVMVNEPKIKFREKKLTSLGGGLFNQGPTGFKKRKLNPGASLRKRDDS